MQGVGERLLRGSVAAVIGRFYSGSLSGRPQLCHPLAARVEA